MSQERSLKNNPDALGPLVIVRPKELALNGTTGTVAEGIYEGAIAKPAGVSKNGKPYKASTEYRIRGENNTLYILNDCRALAEQLTQLSADGSEKVRVDYLGKKVTKAGNDYHDFEVFVK